MAFRIHSFLLLFLVFCSVSGCYITPVRHLASDVALLQVGKTTSEEVIVFLGDPDEQHDLGDGMQKWLYKEKDVGLLQRTPWIGSKLGSPEIRQAVITLKNGVVSSCDYSYSDEDDMGWKKDFSWQEKKK